MEKYNECATCSGLPCPKYPYYRNYAPDGSGVYTLVPCKYEQMRLDEAQVSSRIKSAGIPLRYKNVDIDRIDIDENNIVAIRAAADFINGGAEQNGLYFYGGVGTGKTLLASLIAKKILLRGQSVCFVNAIDLLDDIKDSFSTMIGNDTAQTMVSKMRFLAEVKLLILDDFGAERGTPFAEERLTRLVNERYATNRALVVTSNLAPDDLPYHERIADRLKQLCKVVTISGGSRR